MRSSSSASPLPSPSPSPSPGPPPPSAPPSAIGISFGHSYVSVGIKRSVVGGAVEIIANELGNRLTPACITYTPTQILIGDSAVTASSSASVNRILSAFESAEQTVRIQLADAPARTVDVRELIRLVLADVRRVAERFAGSLCDDCAIAVPQSYDADQRRIISECAAAAGLNVHTVVSDAVAAAIANGYDIADAQAPDAVKRVLVADFGASTSTATILSIRAGIISVVATKTANVGGDAMDEVVAKFFADQFNREYDTDIAASQRAYRRLVSAAEKAKRVLSASTKTSIECDSLYDGLDLFSSLSRAKFESLTSAIVESLSALISDTLALAAVNMRDLSATLLIGGTSRIPRVYDSVAALVGAAPKRLPQPDEVVAYGATIQADIMRQRIEQIAVFNAVAAPAEIQQTFLSAPIGIGVDDGTVKVVFDTATPLPAEAAALIAPPKSGGERLSLALFEGDRVLQADCRQLGNVVIQRGASADGKLIRCNIRAQDDGTVTLTALTLGTSESATVTLGQQTQTNARPIASTVTSEERRRDESYRKQIAAREALVVAANAVLNDKTKQYNDEARRVAESVLALTMAETISPSSSIDKFNDKLTQLNNAKAKLNAKPSTEREVSADDANDMEMDALD